jgi:hypothetical protein
MSETTQDPVTPPGPASAPRDAIIFIPGLFQRRDMIEHAIARRLARAFDHNAGTGSARFSIEEAKEEEFKDGHKSRVVTVTRKDGDGPSVPITDVYELNYQDVLTAAYRRRSPALQAIHIAFMLLANLGRLLASFGAKGKTAAEKLQVVYAGLIFLAIAAYVPILVVGVVATGLEVVRADQTAPAAPTAPADSATPPAAGGAVTGGATDAAATQETGLSGKVLEWAQFAIIFFTAIGLFNRGSLKDFLSETAAHAIPAMGYLDYDQRKGLVLGQLNELLEHIQEKGTAYRRVHIVGYSFGSVVALDAVFPHHVPGARLATIDSITTIGCPFDFMRTYWPDYFTQRRPIPASALRWINIYSSMDILSSDFKDYTKRGKNVRNRGIGLAGVGADDSDVAAQADASAAEPPLERRPDANLRWGRSQEISLLRPLDYFGLVAFRSHGQYWETHDTFDVNSVDLVVRELYASEPALA